MRIIDAVPVKPCYWWVRWYHRRLRKIDRLMVWAALVKYGVPGAAGPMRIQAAWDNFTHSEGQEHWHCPCAENADQYGESKP